MISVPGDRVAIIPIRDPDRIGLIWVPDQAKERTDQGVVKYIGPECKWCTIGAYVAFSGFSGTLFNVEDPERPGHFTEDLIIVREKFVFCEFLDLPSTDVPGLFFRAADGEYFPATYEMGLHLMARSIREAPWHDSINIVTPELKNEEYDE